MSRLLFLVLALLLGTTLQAREPTSHFFTSSDGVRLHYLALGEQGTPVILVHGFTSSARRNWFDTGVAQLLAPNHRVYALDMRNHGESQVLAQREPGIVRDVLDLMGHLGIDKAHLHGYSMGGATTLQILAYAPERLLTASMGGFGISEISERTPTLENIDWEKQLTIAVPTETAIDLSKVALPFMTINGSEDRPYDKTVRPTRELADYLNVILPGYGHMNAVRSGSGYGEHLAFFLRQHDVR